MTSSRNFIQTVFGKRFVLVSYLSALCVLCGHSSAQDWKTVHDGVDYAEVTREISGLKVNMNLLRLDLAKVRLDVHHAFDKALGLETTSTIATRHGAVAAINAGFFRLDKSAFAGDAAGILKIDGILLSESDRGRVALLLKNSATKTTISITQLDINIDLFCIRNREPGRATCPVHGLPIAGVNRVRKDNEIIVYTSAFGSSTLTSDEGIEIVVVKGKVTKIIDGRGSTEIPNNGIVVSAMGKFQDRLTGVKIGDSIFHGMPILAAYARFPRPNGDDNEKAKYFEDITNGVPQLIKNGRIDITWEQEKTTKAFVETRHPRTAVAKLKDGKFLMITVDGRSESSGGIGLQDLAEYLLSLGATDAMNLDGGGSTTMFLDGKVVNHPSDKEGERKVGDAILVTLRKNRR